MASWAWSAASSGPCLDWLTEAHPCKQSVALVITMLGVMAWLLAGGLCLRLPASSHPDPPQSSWPLFTLLTTLCCLVLYRTLVTWGAKNGRPLRKFPVFVMKRPGFPQEAGALASYN